MEAGGREVNGSRKEMCVVLNVLNTNVLSALDGLVAQLVRAPPCHGGGRGFESHPGRFVFKGS